MKYAVRAVIGIVILGWSLQIIGCAAAAARGERANSAAGIGNTAVNFGDEYSSAGSVDAPAATQPTATLPALLNAATNAQPVGNSPDNDQKAAGQLAVNAASQIGLAINQSMSIIMAVLLIMLDRSKTQTVSVLSASWAGIVEKLLGSHSSTIEALTEKLHQSTPVGDMRRHDEGRA